MLVLIMLVLPVMGGQAQVAQEDSLALVAFYQATDGPNWGDNTNWLTGPVASWVGVTVSGDRVTELSLQGSVNQPYGLRGELPDELGNLTQLEVLDLGSNELTSVLPEALSNLAHLQQLDLSNNNLTGTLLPELGNLYSLHHLDLSVNDFTGPIPSALGNLTNLQALGLFLNELTGEIPPELGNLANLTYLNLQANQLTGEIPAALGKLTNLTDLALSLNELTGEIPAELGSLTELTFLSLQLNALTGEIPAELGTLSQLLYLILDYNQLGGPLPPELGNLTRLTNLQLDSNSFEGSLPLSLTNLINLTDFDFSDTGLCEPTDAAFQTWIQGIAKLKGTGVTCTATATEDIAEIPFDFVLEPNYPNPFNSSTRIRYALPQQAPVRLAVYDLQGRLVEVLVERDQPAGRHEVIFEAGALPSGGYFYRLEAGSFRASGRMVLVK